MAIIIGAGTIVSFYGACVVSANWGYNPNTQRLYCIGSWTPTYTYDRPTETLSMTIYCGTGGPIYTTAATETCADANTLIASVTPAACGSPVGSVSGPWFGNSYGYSKDDPQLPGQETWGMQKWVGTSPPTYVLRGISEGSGTQLGTGANPGIHFLQPVTESQSGNVTAGGIGRHDFLTVGVVSQVGGGSTTEGLIGQGSVSMPYTPLWV
jgi:hypothetical protein